MGLLAVLDGAGSSPVSLPTMRRIKKANIRFISLCPKGANKLDVLYKSDGTIAFSTIVKASDSFDEHGEITAVVYAPEHRDSQGDIADAAVIKDAAYDFIRNGAHIDINHDGKPLKPEQARVAETFLVQKGDSRFADWKDTDGKPVDLEGAWAVVLKIDDPELRKLYRTGGWQGVSMGGTATVQAEKSDPLERLASLLNSLQPKQSDDMNPDDMKKALEPVNAQLTTLATSVADLVKVLKPAEKTEAEKAAELAKAEAEKKKAAEVQAPVYKGRDDDLRGLELHAREVQLFELKKSTDFTKPDQIRDYRAAVVELAELWKEQDEADGIDVEAEKAERASRTGVRKHRPSGPGNRDGGAGSAEDTMKAAREHAAEINKARIPGLAN